MPSVSMPSYDQVNAAYQQYLGRQASQDEYQTYWANDPNYGAGISGSGEAAQYASQHPATRLPTMPSSQLVIPNATAQPRPGSTPPPTPYTPPGQPASPSYSGSPTGANPQPGHLVAPPKTGPFVPGAPTPPANQPGAPGSFQPGSPNDPSNVSWIDDALKLAQSTDDPAYWKRVIAADPKAMAGDASAIAYWKARIAQGDGALAVRNGTVQKFNDGGGNTTGANTAGNTTQYSDQSTNLLLNAIMQRLTALQQPIQDPYGDLYAKQALDTVSKLNGDPYTQGDNAALIAQYRDPLTQARDAAKQQEAEAMARRGIDPKSGVFMNAMAQIDKQYQQGISSGTNQLAVKAVAQKQANQAEQLQILDSLVTQGRMSRQEATSRANEILSTAAMPLSVDQQRLQMLLQASGEGQANPSSILSNIMQLGQLTNQTNQINNQQGAANASTWAQIISYMLQGLH